MSDYTNDYENAAASLDLEPVVEVSEVPLVAAEEIVVEEQGYTKFLNIQSYFVVILFDKLERDPKN